MKRRSGVLVHPTSFPSKYGIGDFGSGATDFVDFLERGKQTVWQILPLGHTSFGDSPYQSFSTFAGNPLLISPEILLKKGYLKDSDLENVPEFDKKKVEFGRVINYKYELFRKAFTSFKGNRTKKGVKQAFKAFCEKHKLWLDDYALFVSLKNYFVEKRKFEFETDEYKSYKKANLDILGENGVNDYYYGAHISSFPKDIADRKKQAVEKWTKLLSKEIEFYKFLQFEFFEQWKALKAYANSKNIEIIGDIPIFVAADSADTWSNRNLFKIDSKGNPTEVAGVPPDYFSSTGQLWGNPLYDWEEHKKTGYKWWIARIKNMMELVDVLRIDHFRAFESYWSIPYGEKTAINGEWKKGPGEDIFNAIRKELGDINIIAEDLGDLNPEVIELREKLGLPGMKILQFAFDGNSKNVYLIHNFENTDFVVYTGTHDNDTTLGWYKKSSENVKDYVRRLLNVSGEDIAWDLIREAFRSTARLAVIPIQDVFMLDEQARMNTPGVTGGNWQFRYDEGMLKGYLADGLRYLSKLYNRNLDD